MKYLSLFSGIGGFELGLEQGYDTLTQEEKERIRQENTQTIREQANPGATIQTAGLDSSGVTPQQHANGSSDRQPTCIGYSEIDKYAIQIYEKHFNHKNYGDITQINAKELPDFDLLVGGFPCQAFSIAGKRGGFSDTRGTLFFDIARIVREKQPRLLLLENVKGLLSHDQGRTFYTIISTLDELGYDLQWQVLNSKNFGVPQNRERVFIIGHLRGTSRPEVFPFGGTDEEDNKTNGIKVSGILDTETWRKRHEQIRRVHDIEGISPTIPTGTGGGVMTKIEDVRPVLTPDRPEKRQNGRRFKENGDPSFTLTAQDKHGIYDGMKIRRLTPTECERLQGFPDGWTEEGTQGKISDTQRYKTLGNAVTVNVIREIAKRLAPQD